MTAELAFDISSNIPEVVAGAVQALGLLGKAATDAGAAVGSAGKKTAGSTKSMRDSVEALKMMAYELSEESKRLGDTQAGSAAKLRAMAGAIQASSDRMSDAISTMSKAAGILNRQEVSASSITKWAGLAKIAAADFSEALKSAGAEVAKFKAMTSFDPAAHSKVFGMGRDTIRQATADTKRELAGHYNALGVFISNGQAKLAADLAKSANAHTAATAEMRARAVAEWSAANKALKSSAFGLGRDTIRQATADTKRELAGHYNALGVFISNAQAELAAKASAGTAANAAAQAKALGLGRDTIRQATADTKRELAGHYNALGMFISNAATPAAAAAPSASEIAASAKRSKVEVEALSKSLRHLTIDGNDAHSMARGLASGFNMLWLTWGNLAPLFAGSAISFGVSRTFSIGMEVEQNIKFLEVLGDKTKEQGSVIREELRKIDQSTLFSLTELSKAMVGLEQGGVSGARGLEVVKVAADLAAVGNTNLDVTSRLLMQTMNLFPQTTADVTKSAAQMFQVTKDGALNIEDIGDAMKYASTSGVVYGQTFEDVLVTLKALAAGGIKGTSAGTSWINFLQDIAGRSKPAKAALEELEAALGRTISTFDSKGQARAALDVLSDINEGLSKFKPQAAKELMDRIFNERGIRTAAAAIRDGTVDLGKYKEMLGEVKGEFLTTNAAQLMDTTKGALDILKGTMVGVLDKTFESMGTGFRDTIKNLTSTINSDEFANLMRGMVGSFAALADVAMRVLPELSKIAAVFITFKAVSFAQAAVSGLAASMVPLIGYLNLSAGGMVAAARSAAVAATNVTGLGTSMLVSAAAAKASAAGLEGTAAAAAVATMRLQATTGVARILAVTMGFLANPVVGLVTTLGILGATWWATSQSSQTASEELSAKVWKDGKLNIKVLDDEIAKIKERDAVRAAGMEAPTTELDSLLSEAKVKWDKSRELRRKLEGVGLTEQQKSSRAPFMPKALADEAQAHEAWFALYTRRQEVLDNKAKLQAETEKKRNAGVKAATEKAEADAKRQLSGLDRLGKEGTAQQAAQNKLDNDLRYNRLDEIAKANKAELDGLRSRLNSEAEALKDFRDANMVQEGEYQSRITSITLEGEKAQKAAAISGWLSYAAEIDRLMTGLSAMPKSQISDNDKANRVQELNAKLLNAAEEFNNRMASIDEEANKRERRLATDQYKELDKLRKANETAIANSKDRVQAIRDEQEMADKTLGLKDTDLEATQARLKIELEAKKELRKFDLESIDKIQARDRLRADAELATDDETWEAKHRRADDFDAQLRILAKGRADFEVQTQTEVAETVAAVYRKEFRRRVESMSNALSDGIVDALLTGGREGGDRLRAILEKQLVSEPFTLVVKALIQPFTTAVAGGVQSLVGSNPFGAASGSTALSALSGASSLSTLFGGSGVLATASGAVSGFTTALTAGAQSLVGLQGTTAQMVTSLTSAGHIAAPGAAAGASAGSAVASVAVPAAAALVGLNALGVFRKTKQVGTGLSGTIGASSDIDTYAHMRKSGTLFRGPKHWKKRTDSVELTNVVNQATSQVIDRTKAMADALGMDASLIAGYTLKIDEAATEFKRNGMTTEQVQAKFAQILSDQVATYAEGVAGQVSGIQSIQKVGETAQEALSRAYGWWSAEQQAQIAILNAQGKSQEALRRQRELDIALLGEDEKAVRRRIFALEDQVTVATEAAGLQKRLNAATMTRTELLALERAQLDPLNQAMFDRVIAAEAAAEERQVAAQAAEDAAQASRDRAEAIKAEREGLNRQLLEAIGDTAAIRALELAALDATNRAIQEHIWAIEDTKAAYEKATSAAQAAYNTLERSVGAERDSITKTYEAEKAAIGARLKAQQEGYQAQIAAAEASADKIRDIAGALSSAVKAVKVDSPATNRAAYDSARAVVSRKNIYDPQLKDALDAVSGDSKQFYGKFEDYAFDQAVTAASIRAMDAAAQGQLSAAEALLNSLKASDTLAQTIADAELAALDERHRANLDKLQATLDLGKSQLDALLGIDTSVLSVADAVNALSASIAAAYDAQNAQIAALTAAKTGGATGGGDGGGAYSGETYTDFMGSIVPLQDGQSRQWWEAVAQAGTSAVSSLAELEQRLAEKGKTDVFDQLVSGFQLGSNNFGSNVTYTTLLDSDGRLITNLGFAPGTTQDEREAQREAQAKLWKVPGFDVGINRVPFDMLARIHEGEAILPAQFNPFNPGAQTFGGNSDEVVAELRALNERLARIEAATAATAGHTAGTDRKLARVIKNDAITTESSTA